MNAHLFSRLAALALVGIFVALGSVTLLQSRKGEQRMEELAESQRLAELYSDAHIAALTGESVMARYIILPEAVAFATYLGKRDDLMALIDEIAGSEAPADQEFGAWAQGNLAPLPNIFAQLGADPPVALDQVVLEYTEAYIAIYAAVQDGAIGDTEVPSLVDMATAGPLAQLTAANPVSAIMEAKALEKQTASSEVLVAIEAAEERESLISGSLYGAGLLAVVPLVWAIFVFRRREAVQSAEISVLRRVATTDSLTGLGNRRGYEEATKRIAMAGVHGGLSAALVVMDLDEFKQVNDRFGHERGDTMLRKFSDILSGLLPAGAKCFRVGGDEFAVLMPGATEAAALVLGERIRAEAERSLPHGVTVSAGVSELDAANPDDSLLRQQADAALYQGKLRGRNVVVAYEPSPHSAPVFPAAKLQAVRDLLFEGRIEPVFQPIWDLHTHTLLAYEALSRPHEDYGLSGPQEAFDIADWFGHAADLDALCRRHILAAVPELPTNARVFINLSPASLIHQSFTPVALLQELKDAQVDPSRVVFEITERSHLPVDAIVRGVEQLRAHGLAIALDDVGSGNSGLEILRLVHFDFVKVDRSVLLAAGRGSMGRAAMMAILAFAAESETLVVAEGVEDEDMFGLVQEVALSAVRGDPGLIHGVQGFLFGRPVPADVASQHWLELLAS